VTVILSETQLYEPVRRYWSEAGYEVRGEVSGCDVLARLGEEMVAIELKTSLNLEVILQATQRQKLCSQAWIAVPRNNRILRTRRWQQLMHLLRRLELGLLLVDLNHQPPRVEAAQIALPFDRSQSYARNRGQAKKLRQEFERRHGDRNTGGATRTQLMTVYREQVLLVAALLSRNEPASAAQLRRFGAPEKAYAMIYRNYYGWFERCGTGHYQLTESGRQAVCDNAELIGQMLVELSCTMTNS